ncbi:MAG TPA: hypothetical protein VGA64_12395 [Candidatus Polarisedimenticolia bacterium]
MIAIGTGSIPRNGRPSAASGLSRAAASISGAAGAALLIALGSLACGQGSDKLGFSGKPPSTPQEVLAELKDHQQRIDEATDGMMKRIQEFNASRQPGQATVQFSEIFGQEFSDAQRDVLNQMIEHEKDVSYKSLLQKIVVDRGTLQELQEKVMRLEQSLPDQFAIAKQGDTHRDLATAYLTAQPQVDEAKVKALLAQVDLSDELSPGNKVWFFYDQPRDTFRTYVTQGEAGRSPLAVRRALHRKLITERDQAVAERDEAAAARDQAATARDAAQAEVQTLNQVKSGLETDITGLRQNKAELEANIDRVNRDLAFRENSLFYHAASVRELKTQGVVTSVRKRLHDIKSVRFDTALDLREKSSITLSPDAFGLQRIDKVRVLPSIFQEGRDFTVETSKTTGSAKVTILDADLFKGKEIVLAVGG